MRQSSDSSHGSVWDSVWPRLTHPAARAAIAGIVFLSLAVVARSGGDGGGRTPLEIVLLLAILGVVVLGLIGIALTLAGFDADAGEIADRLADDPIQRRLLTRWLERARWARFVGGLSGCIVWALGFQTNFDLLVCGSVGICVAAVLAESHHLRRPNGPRAARLEVRTVAGYLAVGDRRWMVAVAGSAGVVVVVGLVLGASQSSISWAIAALVTIGLVHLAQRRVASRGRPAVNESLRRADDLARSLAIGRGLARPATYAGLAMLARSLFELRSVLAAGPFLGIVAWFCGAGLWWRNRRLGLGHLADEPPQVAYA